MALTQQVLPLMFANEIEGVLRSFLFAKVMDMKVRNSLRALMGRHRDNKLVRRRGRYYIINKVNKRFKARQG